MPLSELQIERYSRQIILPEVGSRGQCRLLQSAVTVIGDGRPGYTVMSYLTAAGVGRVAWHASEDTLSGGGREVQDDLRDLNPDVHLTVERFDPAADSAAPAEPAGALLIAVPADARTLTAANLLATRQRAPLLVGIAVGQTGCVAAFAGCPCASCWEVSWPLSTSAREDSAVAGVIGALTALWALQLLLGIGARRWGTVLQYDGRTSTMTESPVAARPGCPACASASRTNT